MCSAWSTDGTTVFAGEWGDRGRQLRPAAAAPPPPPAACPLALSRLGAVITRCRPSPACCTPPAAGGCDNGVKMWNLQTNQQQQVAQHAAPIRHCFFIRQMNMLVTGSWDKTVKVRPPPRFIAVAVTCAGGRGAEPQPDVPLPSVSGDTRPALAATRCRSTTRDAASALRRRHAAAPTQYWDLRQANPVHTQQMPERVYAMDVQDELMVVGTADRQIQASAAAAACLAAWLHGCRRSGLIPYKDRPAAAAACGAANAREQPAPQHSAAAAILAHGAPLHSCALGPRLRTLPPFLPTHPPTHPLALPLSSGVQPGQPGGGVQEPAEPAQVPDALHRGACGGCDGGGPMGPFRLWDWPDPACPAARPGRVRSLRRRRSSLQPASTSCACMAARRGCLALLPAHRPARLLPPAATPPERAFPDAPPALVPLCPDSPAAPLTPPPLQAFPDKSGYLVGSVEGRVAVHHVEDALQSKNFTFKCHRCAGLGRAGLALSCRHGAGRGEAAPAGGRGRTPAVAQAWQRGGAAWRARPAGRHGAPACAGAAVRPPPPNPAPCPLAVPPLAAATATTCSR